MQTYLQKEYRQYRVTLNRDQLLRSYWKNYRIALMKVLANIPKSCLLLQIIDYRSMSLLFQWHYYTNLVATQQVTHERAKINNPHDVCEQKQDS